MAHCEYRSAKFNSHFENMVNLTIINREIIKLISKISGGKINKQLIWDLF
jgi:hypothetical protein